MTTYMQAAPIQQIGIGSYVEGKGYREAVPGGFVGGSVMMPQTTYMQPAVMPSYGGSMVMPTTSYTTMAAPMTTTAVDVNRDGRADYVVTGTDFNRDGIPDAMERPVTTTYVTQAPAMTTAMPTYTGLPTTSSMVAYPQTTGPFVFYPAGQEPATPAKAPASPAKRDVKVAKKKKAGTCGCCCPAKKAPAKKK